MVCAGWETPTPINPYKTMWWDGVIGYGNNIGNQVNDGTYIYEIDLYGCKFADGDDHAKGHNLSYWGEIEVVGGIKSHVSGGGNSGEVEQKILADLENQLHSEPEINVYPNPTTKSIFVALVGMEDNSTYFELYDVSGKKVLELFSVDLRTELDLSFLARGVYQLKVKNSENEFYENIVLQ